ncbi:D-alanine--D-alanine ligase [uncultured archaeon]|nr:D-alanine--D-alanine ligase [uncultured archaeon]
MSVIITNADSAKALVVTRSLGRKKIEVVTTGSERLSAAFFSRYSINHFLYPSPLKSPFGFINTLEKYVINSKIDVVMPINSVETLLVSKYKYKLEPHTKVPFADYSKMIRLHNKEELMKVAEEINLPIPKTYVIKNTNEIRNIAKVIEYPVVIKIKDSTSSIGVQYAHSEDEFISGYKQVIQKFSIKDASYYPLVQEYIPGDGYGVSVLFNQGDLRALFTHKRLREYPVSGGGSTLRESVRSPEMEKIAKKLLEHVDWNGLAMVEFKMDKRTKKPVLLEVNPRFWGSVNQAVASGVDFPYLLYKMAMEGDVDRVLNYKLGVKTRLLMSDMRALFAIFRKTKKPAFVLKEFINRTECDEVAYDDLLPGFTFLYKGIKELIKNNDLHYGIGKINRKD